VTIAGSNVAKQRRWKIRPAQLKSVKTANGEHMFIEGLATKDFSVEKKRILDDLMLGLDWMKK